MSKKGLSQRSVAKLLESAHEPTGCMYGVHTWEYVAYHSIWHKVCVSVNNGRECGATYILTQSEVNYIERNKGAGH